MKTNKNFVLYIDDPDILKSQENSYVIFGEAKFLDFTGNLAGEKAANFQKPEEATAKEVTAETENKPGLCLILGCEFKYFCFFIKNCAF